MSKFLSTTTSQQIASFNAQLDDLKKKAVLRDGTQNMEAPLDMNVNVIGKIDELELVDQESKTVTTPEVGKTRIYSNSTDGKLHMLNSSTDLALLTTSEGSGYVDLKSDQTIDGKKSFTSLLNAPSITFGTTASTSTSIASTSQTQASTLNIPAVSSSSGNFIVSNASSTQTITSKVAMTDTTASTSHLNGSLVIAGGVGIAGRLNVAKMAVLNTVVGDFPLQITANQPSQDIAISLNGSGGAKVGMGFYSSDIKGCAVIQESKNLLRCYKDRYAPSNAGSKVIDLDLEQGRVEVYNTSNQFVCSDASSTASTFLTVPCPAVGGADRTITFPISTGTLATTADVKATSEFSSAISLTDSTASSSWTTGALKVVGGVGIGGSIFSKTLTVNNPTSNATYPASIWGNAPAQGITLTLVGDNKTASGLGFISNGATGCAIIHESNDLLRLYKDRWAPSTAGTKVMDLDLAQGRVAIYNTSNQFVCADVGSTASTFITIPCPAVLGADRTITFPNSSGTIPIIKTWTTLSSGTYSFSGIWASPEPCTVRYYEDDMKIIHVDVASLLSIPNASNSYVEYSADLPIPANKYYATVMIVNDGVYESGIAEITAGGKLRVWPIVGVWDGTTSVSGFASFMFTYAKQ